MKTSSLQTRILIGVLAICLGSVVYAGVKADRMARIGAGYKAKIACSEIFLASRPADIVLANEFAGIDPLMAQIPVRVDEKAQIVSAAGPFGLGRATAIYREWYGCTLANGGRVAQLPEIDMAASDNTGAAVAEPNGTDSVGEQAGRIDNTLPSAPIAAVQQALDEAFAANQPGHRGVLVIVDGAVVAEKYADGFDAETPFLSWSMGKSVMATLIGAAVHDGFIDIDDAAPVAEWDDAERSAITWRHLLQMQSGLAFEEDYDTARSDVNRMLFEAADAGSVGAKQPLAHEPGTFWYYSSGTTNLLSRTLRAILNDAAVDYHSYGRRRIFAPIGADSVVMEPDASGTFIASSFVYATARDWARLGLLYLNGGSWNGVQILPENWSAIVAEPAGASDRQYGAQFWLNLDGENGRARFFPGLPEEAYFFSGHEGQYVIVVPDLNAVIVRVGMTRGGGAMKASAPLFAAIDRAIRDNQ